MRNFVPSSRVKTKFDPWRYADSLLDEIEICGDFQSSSSVNDRSESDGLPLISFHGFETLGAKFKGSRSSFALERALEAP